MSNWLYRFSVLLGVCIFLSVSACSDSAEESKKPTIRRLRNVEKEPVRRAIDPVAEEQPQEDLSVAPEPVTSREDRAPIIDQLDSALAASDEEAVLDFMLDLEDQGGAQAVQGLGMVIDLAADDDLKLDAIASLSMLMDGEDISPPLLRAVDDQSTDVRIEALDVIAENEMVDLLPILRLRIRRESDPETLETLEDTIFELEEIQKLDRR